MPITFVCGFECGTALTATNSLAHIYALSGGAAFDTTTKRTGSRAMRINGVGTVLASNAYSGTIAVGRVYLRFATLPSASGELISCNVVNGPNIYFNQTDSKLYARCATTAGATGILVTTGQWYLVDYFFQINTSGDDTCGLRVDGVNATTVNAAGASATGTAGFLAGLTGGDVYYDDWVITTDASYIGEGSISHFVPTSDGTHNIAGANDFERGNTGTDILNSTTDAYTLVDDIPLPNSGAATADGIGIIAPPASTDYVELVLGPAPGISAPTTAPRAASLILAHVQDGTATCSWEALARNATFGTYITVSWTTIAGTTAVKLRNAVGTGSISLSEFNDLRVRISSADAAPNTYIEALMLEAEFPPLVPPVARSMGLVTRIAVDRASTY
jgi:hypothetical protein